MVSTCMRQEVGEWAAATKKHVRRFQLRLLTISTTSKSSYYIIQIRRFTSVRVVVLAGVVGSIEKKK